jgi:hypothetical protein
MSWRAETGRDVRFVLVTAPAPVAAGTDAALAGFGTVSEIGLRRVRAAMGEFASSGLRVLRTGSA